MSRNTLLGQSLVRNANALSFGVDGSDSGSKHWKRDWYSPSKSQPQSSLVTPSATPTPFGDESSTPQLEQQRYPFKVKAWVVDEFYSAVVDGDEEDVFDLDLYSSGKIDNGPNGLSDAAIRGAVATDGAAIPGISKSTDDAADGNSVTPDVKTEDTTSLEQTPVLEETKIEIDEPVKPTETTIQGPAAQENTLQQQQEEQRIEESTQETQDVLKIENPAQVVMSDEPKPVASESTETPEKDGDGDTVIN